ncbi:MAG: (2Fe-2S)-binding protein [Acidobacteria bacterium]|nr:(2Fe-2S)-binding protein [Acidobacteriota bacterium]MBU4307182.1 (2Fe-2S)-binding protein [Acidobacteriota bacterium]MBU4405003.1 (2Fe-2S)-binding protein [Acidobacteriota bacterium]MCG2810925.1 (2Fe-2S)-binding protein [Candidatus Aminicenantes bacterium]
MTEKNTAPAIDPGRPTENLRVTSIRRRPAIRIQVNGRSIEATPGETVLAALTAAGFKVLKKSNVRGEARGPFCGMGVCYECLVTINGVPKQRSCMTEVEDNMEIQTYEPPPD